MFWTEGQVFLPDLQLLNISDIFCAFWIINFLVWNFLYEKKTCPASISHTQNTALTVLLKFVFCITLPLHPYFLFLLILFCHLFFWPLSWTELSSSQGPRIFSQGASGSPCPPHQRAPISPPCQELGMLRAVQSCCSWGGNFCSPFLKAGLSLACSHSPCKPFLHVTGKNPALWNAVLSLVEFYVTFFPPQTNAIFWGLHYLDL